MKIARQVIRVLFLLLFFLVIMKGQMFLWLGIFALSLLSGLIFGRFYCGYICPMNTVMGISGKVAKKLNWQSKKVPKILKTKVLPWLVLGLMIFTMVISKKVLHKDLPLLVILMAISVLFTFRFEEWVFHNHVCPYGALLRITGKSAKFTTHVEETLCIGCKKCESVCPSQAVLVDIVSKKARIDSEICHQCHQCIEVCPVEAIGYRR